MSWNEDKHQAMRKWAAMPGVDVNDPENLIFRDRKTGQVQFKGRSSMKAYKRIEEMYNEYLREQASLKLPHVRSPQSV